MLPATPDLLALIVFGAGLILLVSGATPGIGWRPWLDDALPLAVIELSHFSAAWRASRSCSSPARCTAPRRRAAPRDRALVVGVVASLAKGLDYEEALALTVVLGAVVPLGRQF